MPTTWCAVVFGPKGAGKSTTAFGINKANYKTAVIDFDGNSAQTIKSNISPAKQSNFKVWNVKALVNFKDLEGSQILTESEKVVDILEGQIYDEVAEYQPDIIVADGYQRFVWLAEMSNFLDEVILGVMAFSYLLFSNFFCNRILENS